MGVKKHSNDDENSSKAEGFNLFLGSAEHNEYVMDHAGLDEFEQEEFDRDREDFHEQDLDEYAEDEHYDAYREDLQLYSVDMTRKNVSQAVAVEAVQKLRSYDLTVKTETAERGLGKAQKTAKKTEITADDEYVAEVLEPSVQEKVEDVTCRVLDKSDFEINI